MHFDNMSLPAQMTISQLKEIYVQGIVTPEVVMSEIVERARCDGAWNVWITPPSMERIAPYLERLREQDPSDLPLWGIPFAVKDNIDVAGMPTTAACAAYAYMPERHSTVVERLVAAGAVPVGKTNLDQFATGLVGTRSPYGETHNALQRELISGGSSSGSAVAVARGHVAFSLGTDTAGSGRVPAALNNLVGWKPSIGAWSTRGVVPACASLDCVTVFSHNMEDALIVDEIVRGVDEEDCWSRSVKRSSAMLPRKLYLPKEDLEFYGPFAEEYRAAWETTVGRLLQLNIPIEYVDTSLFAEAAAILYEGPWIAERWTALGPFIESHPEAVFSATERVLRSGAKESLKASDVFAAIHRLQELKREAWRLLRDRVLVMPTCGGTWTRNQVREDPIATNSAMGNYTNHCNLLDLCAVSVPSAPAAENLPFGITFFAPAGGEGMLEGVSKLFFKRKSNVRVAVCGLHMRGLPLEHQMREYGACFIKEARTAAKYKMLKLPTAPTKPGLVKTLHGGASIPLEIWEMPMDCFGAFVASIPSPLGIGKIELDDGTEVSGFLCEDYIVSSSKDVTALGGWRNVIGQ